MPEEPIDLKEFMERVQDDKDLLLELLDIFQEDFQQKRKGLADAVAQKDVEQIRMIAHSLKGSSGNISAKAMHALCFKIEQQVKGGDTNIGAALTELDQLFAAVQGHIVKIKQDFKG